MIPLRELALAAAVTLLALLAFEGAGRLLWGPPVVHQFTPPRHDEQTDFSVRYETGEDGSRVTCAESGREERLALFIGDSFVFGQGVENGADFPALIDCRLPEVAVRNYGSIGRGLDYYEAVTDTLVPEETAAVVLVLFENDLPPRDHFTPTARLKRWLYRHSHLVALARKAKHRLGFLRNAETVAEHRVEGRLNNPKSVAETDPGFFTTLAAPDPADLERFRRTLDELLATLAERAPRAALHLAMIPEASTLSPGHRAFYNGLGIPRLPSFGRPTAIYQTARAVCEASPRCRFHHLFPLLAKGGGDAYFPHDFHLNAEGHALIADLLGPILADPSGRP